MIKLIGISYIHWESYLKEALTLLDRSPTKNLDKENLHPQGLENFLISLNEFEMKDSSTELKNLDHIYLTFLCSLPEKALMNLLLFRDMNITISEDATTFIMSGSLYDMFDIAKLEFISSNKEGKKFCNELFEIIETAFPRLTNKYRKEYRKDGIFTLVKK
jgi:hypothetical protein